MPTAVEAVERYLQTDVALADALLRDLVRLRQTARWLLARYDWDASEEAVVSALRRYIETHGQPPLAPVRALLPRTSVDIRTGLALIAIPRNWEVLDALNQTWADLKPLDILGVSPGRRRTTILIEEMNLDLLRDALPRGAIREVHRPVTILRLTLPDEPGAILVVSDIVATLHHHGIEALDVLTSVPETTILIPGAATAEAYEIATEATRAPGRWESSED